MCVLLWCKEVDYLSLLLLLLLLHVLKSKQARWRGSLWVSVSMVVSCYTRNLNCESDWSREDDEYSFPLFSSGTCVVFVFIFPCKDIFRLFSYGAHSKINIIGIIRINIDWRSHQALSHGFHSSHYYCNHWSYSFFIILSFCQPAISYDVEAGESPICWHDYIAIQNSHILSYFTTLQWTWICIIDAVF